MRFVSSALAAEALLKAIWQAIVRDVKNMLNKGEDRIEILNLLYDIRQAATFFTSILFKFIPRNLFRNRLRICLHVYS
ncbi:unnamed protein product [Cochlearia groenlandica]